MERSGDVATEFNRCRSENFCLNTSLFETECDKMCKDDNSESLFCKMSGKMRSDNVMTSGFEAQHEISISALKSQCLEKLNRSEADFVNSDEHVLSVIHQKTEDAMNNCLLPIWEKTMLCDNPLNPKSPGNLLLSDDSFVNGEKLMNDTKNSFQITSSCNNSNAIPNLDSSLKAMSDSLQQTCMEELSLSSIEEISISSPVAGKMKRNHNTLGESKSLYGNVSSDKDPSIVKSLSSPYKLSSLSFSIPRLDVVKEIETSPKSEMPELIPTICLDDDDEEEEFNDNDINKSPPSMEKKSCEKTNIADSPEMPKLVPFSTDLEDIMKIKKEHLDSDETSKNDNFQLMTSAKRKLFLEYEADSLSSIKKSKPEAELENCINKNISPETFTLDDSMSYQSGAFDSENETSLNKKEKKFENPDFQNFFSEMKRNLKRLNENNKISEDIESQCSLKPSNQSQMRLRKLSLDSCLISNSADIPAVHEASAIEGGENESKFSFKHCLPSNDSDDNDSLASKPECQDIKNSSSEGPEIEEIEGVRFFQFRSKHAMEEFNKIPLDMEMSVEMIVPTKTTDITQIKGWRNKYFAPDSQLQLSCTKSESNIDECSQNAVSLPPLDEQVDKKCVDFCIQDDVAKLASSEENKNIDDLKCLAADSPASSPVLTSTPIKSDPDQKNTFDCEILTSTPVKSDVDEKDHTPIKLDIDQKDKLCSVEVEKTEDSIPSNPLSAFVSKKLDDFLLNSSTLNISLLQKVNPNIKPIPPDAPILGIGKLRKTDDDSNILYKRKFFYKIRDDRDEPLPVLSPQKNSSAPLITLSSSSDESSSDDDIPVADLYSKVNQRRSRPTRSQLDRCMKRRTSDSSTDQASQRVVLRLTKQSRGTTEGYKVSEISVEKQESGEFSSKLESNEILPSVFKKADGSLSTIKEGIFLKESEPKLLEEFLNNLNMYGTSKDVAMLVQSNQSYFVKGPVLTAEHCSEALDALASNKEFLDLKSKVTPKKKLKTWQKYLPKKLSKTQQQQISYKSSQQNAVANFDSSERLINAKDKIRQTKMEEQDNSNKTSQPQKSSLINSKIIGKVSDSKDGISKLDDKATFPNRKTSGMKKNMKSKHLILQKKKEMRRKSKLDIDAQLALIERGKRSIRLPARYLDSAVLAAGTEWVSPIFVEDEKKTRKQLLDVLDKIIPNKESDIPTEKNTVNLSNNASRKKGLDSDKPQKRISKESPVSKKQKCDNTMQNVKVSKLTEKQSISIGSKNPDENTSSNEILYPMPLCICSPCSRTASFQKIEKSFVCFSEHNKNLNDSQHEKNNLESESVSKGKSIKPGSGIEITKVDDLDKSKENESDKNFIDNGDKKTKSLSCSDSVSAQKSNQNESSPPKIVSNSVNISTPMLKKSLSSTSIIMTNENYCTQPSGTKVVYSNPQLQLINSANNKGDSVSNELVNSHQILNISTTGATNKVLLLVPPVNSIPKKAPVPLLSNSFSIQKVQKFTPESRSKPPILARKTVVENQNSSSKNMYVPPPLSTLSNNSFNQTSVLLKLPKASENSDTCMSIMYGSSQMTSLIKGSSLSSASSLLSIPDNSNLVSNVSQQKMSLVKAIKLGDKVFLCPTKTKSSPLNSNLNSMTVNSEAIQGSPSLLNIRSSEIPVNNAKVPILPSPLKAESLNSDNTNAASVSQKTSNEIVEQHQSSHRIQSSERRRKSPLSKRKFHDSSDSEVDVDTIDKDFDAALSLKRYQVENAGDVFDNDCAFTFLSDLSTLLSPHKRKTISERMRRQLITSMSDKIRRTSKFFENAKSLAEILNRASFAVRQISMQNQSRVLAKKILKYRNAQLLKRLNDNIEAIPDPKSRIFVKKKLLQVTGCAWEKDRDKRERKEILSPLLSADSSYSSLSETNPSPVINHSILKGSQSDIGKVNSEIDGTPIKSNLNECCVKSPENIGAVKNLQHNFEQVGQPQPQLKVEDHFVIETDVIEQPHVQLRILEASSTEEKIETNLQIKQKDPENKTPKVSHEQPSLPSSINSAKKRLQFRVSSDANTSDDDHLVIDLSDDNSNPEAASSPQKDLTSSVSSKNAIGSPPMKKFPGLIPLFPTDFLKDCSKLEVPKPCVMPVTKAADSGANDKSSACGMNQKIVAIKSSIPGLMSIQPVDDEQSDVGTLDSQMNSTLSVTKKILDSSKYGLHQKNGQTPSSLTQTLVSNKSPSANGDISRHSVADGHNVSRLHKLNAPVAMSAHQLKQNIPEEIVIDDSDDEVMEIGDSSLSRTSKPPVQHPHPGINTGKESQVQVSHL